MGQREVRDANLLQTPYKGARKGEAMTTRRAERDDTTVMLLGSLVESAGLVQAASGCALRWGLAGFDAHGVSNRDNLLRELDDMKSAIKRLEKVLLPSSMLVETKGASHG